MIFNSLEFALFLPIVFIIYWSLNKQKLVYQNVFLLASSYVFYGWWDYRFLSLIVFSSCIDYIIGKTIYSTKEHSRRRLLLIISIIVNLGFLGYFKYSNFFIDSFVDAFTFFGFELQANRLSIVLPVGISFYTFQTLSYTIDIYRKKLEPATNIVSFFAYVSFFPQLVAGPIERAVNLLPQFYSKRKFEYKTSVDGLRQVLWGLFKKVVIADNCAVFVNDVFSNYEVYNSSSLCLAAVLFAFQIYCDFSGYSDIAIGTARLFGFDLMKNFAFPYFSRDIAEFWRRWHISLSTWFRDYVYIPLGGSRVSEIKKIRNTFIIFLVSGFWHGANWTYIIWGLINAIYFLPLLLTNRNRRYLEDIKSANLASQIKNITYILKTFVLTCFAWIFFRADNLNQAFIYLRNIFIHWSATFELVVPSMTLIVLLCGFVSIEWVNRAKEHALALNFDSKARIWRWSYYLFLIILIYVFQGKTQEFIYFQF